MKTGLMSLCAATAMTVLTCGALAQDATPASKPAAAKPAAAKVRTEWQGVIAVPATNAAADVVATLTTKEHKTKAFALKLSPVADATVAAQIKDLVIKGASVKIKGELSSDGTTILVKSVTEVAPAKDPEHKKAAEKTATRKQ